MYLLEVCSLKRGDWERVREGEGGGGEGVLRTCFGCVCVGGTGCLQGRNGMRVNLFHKLAGEAELTDWLVG